MNAVEIEEAITALAGQPYDAAEFPFSFLEAFGNKATTINRLRSGNSNNSDVENGVLQRNNIHLAVSKKDGVATALTALRASPKTTAGKCKFILATDGEWLEAEDLNTGETVGCKYEELPDHFGFFLSLAGISTVKQIRDNPIDVRATSRLNQLYVELLRDNPDWESEDGRHNMNHFMAKLIFCFFAEDTGIFLGENLFTDTIEKMSDSREGNIDFVIGECFRAMDTKVEDRSKSKLPRWADAFPYVNGELFGGENRVPKFTRRSRSYLIHSGKLDWQAINPDIFGSMIQAIAEDEERGELGMHYTSVPNILKVLNPLFLDDLREQLEAAGDNARKLLNLRNRMAKIRVFDPACGSGNFLVVAYKQMREIEFEVNKRRGEADRRSDIPLTNFRGIEIRDFACEVARLALIIAEYQCDVEYRDQKSALAEFLPLDSKNWITCGNALRLDWLSICPPTGEVARIQSDDLFENPLDKSEIEFENDGGETFICGNPPFAGQKKKSQSQRDDMRQVYQDKIGSWGELDYVTCFFYKAAEYIQLTASKAAFVSTNSITQGRHVPSFWPHVFALNCSIFFAHRSFAWRNNAAKNAAVYCVSVGIASNAIQGAILFEDNTKTACMSISAYLTPGKTIFVKKRKVPLSKNLSIMKSGNMPLDGGHLLLSPAEAEELLRKSSQAQPFIKPLVGAVEINRGLQRFCLWIEDDEISLARQHDQIAMRIDANREFRKTCTAPKLADRPHAFRDTHRAKNQSIILPNLSSERRGYRTPILRTSETICTNLALAIYDGSLYEFSILSSRLHHVWVEAVCGKLKQDYRYSNDQGWHTFPLPKLTARQIQDLTSQAKSILLSRESNFPDSLNDMYNSNNMPLDLRAAHERNDEVLERIYIGRRFKNDTERLEKLFELYSKMIEVEEKGKQHA